MNIAFYIDEMNYRGVANQTFQLALNNKKILRNNSIIFYNKRNYRNKKDVIQKFKNKFIVHGISNFKEIEGFKIKNKLDFLYTQKSGNKDNWNSKKIKTSAFYTCFHSSQSYFSGRLLTCESKLTLPHPCNSANASTP